MTRTLSASLLFAAVVAANASAQNQPPRAGATPPKADSSVRPVRSSWTSDRMLLAIGDVVTVLIDERTLASANLKENASDKRAKKLGLDIEPPAAPGAPSTATRADVSFANDGASQRSGQAVRENTFSSEMSARVVAISPTGMVQLRGTKLVVVDKSKQEVVLTGWARPQDIAISTNTIPSFRLADASITYGQQGALGKPKSGLLSKLLSAIWP